MHIEGCELVLNCGNVGYRVAVGSNLLQLLRLKVGDEKELAVYTAVKEDELRLFGFESFVARQIFTVLLTVNGIGPKAAMNIVDQILPHQIVSAIQQNNYDPFLSVSGIGKKTAQRIVVDLQGKMKDIALGQGYQDQAKSLANSTDMASSKTDLIIDAKSALMNLGFNEKKIRRAIQNHFSDTIDLDELIRRCLGDLHN